MRGLSVNDRDVLAIHESGHAVIGLLASLSLVRVGIRPARRSGICLHAENFGRLEHAKYLRACIVCSLAGGLAVARARGGKPHYSAGDRRHASDAALQLTAGDRNAGQRLLAECQQEARAMLEKPQTWNAVIVLAAELLERERVDGREAAAIVKQALREWDLP
jgi:hypothetical protein